MEIKIPNEKAEYIEQLMKMDTETLRILAELSKKPGIEKKLKEKLWLIKSI